MHVGWWQCGHGLSSRPCESCDLHILTPLLDFFGYPDGAATELYSGTLKLRCSSTPFPRNFPLGRCLISLVGIRCSGPGPSFHFPDGDTVREQPAKRFRITGKSSAVSGAHDSFGDLPTPKRWKRLVPQGTLFIGDEDGPPPFLFPRIGVG